MKKRFVIAVVVLIVLVATAFSMHFINSQSNIPDIELVCQQLQLEGNEEEFVLRQFKGCSRDALVKAWGNPTGELSGFYGDFWALAENKVIVVCYSSDSIVEHIILRHNQNNKKQIEI